MGNIILITLGVILYLIVAYLVFRCVAVKWVAEDQGAWGLVINEETVLVGTIIALLWPLIIVCIPFALFYKLCEKTAYKKYEHN